MVTHDRPHAPARAVRGGRAALRSLPLRWWAVSLAERGCAVSALSRVMLAVALGIKPDPADAEEFGELFDRTPLYGLDVPFLSERAATGHHEGDQ